MLTSRCQIAALSLRRFQRGYLLHRGGGSRRQILLTVSSDQVSQYNIYTAASSPATPVDVIVTINSGVALQAGLTTGSGWVSGSTVKVVNNGTIAGIGGAGGNGDSITGPSGESLAGNGVAGGDAIAALHINLTIDNTNGFVYGGGGGGGGGGMGSDDVSGNWGSSNCGPGGGGGGARGYNNAAGGSAGSIYGGGPIAHDGIAGSSSAAGAGGGGSIDAFLDASGGSGGQGGDWGAAGTDGQGGTRGGSGAIGGGGIGGAAGKAVALNGFTVTWLGGNNSTQVKGIQA